MVLHLGQAKGHFPVGAPVKWDPVRRAPEENHDWLRDLAEHSQDLLCVHDLEGRFLSVNPGPARLLGCTVEEMLETPMRNFVDPQFRDQFDVYLRDIAQNGESRGLLTVVTRSGEQRIWEYHNTLRTDGVERPIVRGIAHDVTDRIRAEKVLRASNQQLLKAAQEREQVLKKLTLFRTLLDQSNDAVQVVDRETLRFIDVNDRACLELGYSREELLSMRVSDIDTEIHNESLRDHVVKQLRVAGCVTIETTHRRKDGTTFPVEVNMRRVVLDRPYVVAVSRDITVRKRVDDRLREFERVVENLDEMIVVVDRECRYVLVNRAFLNFRQMTREQVLGHSVAEMTDPGVFETVVKEKLEECFRGKALNCDITVDHPAIGKREISVKYLPVEGVSGIGRVAVVMRDVTEQKRAEAALRESEARERTRATELETVLNVVPVPVCIAQDPQCLRITGNRAAHEEMRVPPWGNFSLGDTSDEGPKFRLMENGVEVPLNSLPLQQAAITGKLVYGRALTMVFPDGTQREELVNVVPLVDDQGRTRGVVGASIDVTELKRAERALRESEMRFRTVFERSPIGIALVEPASGRFVQANPKFLEITERSEQELLQLDVRSITHPDDIEESRRQRQLMTEGKLERYDLEKRYVRPDGAVRWVRVSVVPMWGDGKAPRLQIGMVEDITERRQAEEAIATLVQHVRADSSENFFTSMALQLAKCLEADYTIIGELVNGKPEKVRTLGVCNRGVIADSFTYELANTPCARVAEQGICSYESGVADLFPQDDLLRQMKIDGYAGTPLRDSRWRTIGIMLALYTRPMRNVKLVESILQLFSARTAAEIERKRTEQALRESEERFRVALKNSPIAVFNQDRDLRYTWLYDPQLDRAPNKMLGKTTRDVFGPEEGIRSEEVRKRVLETGVGSRHEVTVVQAGKKRYLDTTIEPLLGPTGDVVGLTGAAMDITDLRETTEALREAKKKLTEEKLYLEQEIDTELGFDEIIGQSRALLAVMANVSKVADSDATVLLLGETGTGKELVARAIHRLSLRSTSSFIKLNCAAIPSGLLESELFGNEKGAFTGAVSKKIGRLELADKGTLFLDEIGEISLALQPKLLRVLQDQEFERLGGTHTLKVDFRLIAATNRDLVDSVREHEFRSDLYYRLNVFPLRVPPLRERVEDIQLLVEHFVRKFARRMNKNITSIPTKTIETLKGWTWPGNVRELENFIERSVILTQGSVLVAPLSELRPLTAQEAGFDETLAAAEREHIMRALRESHGQIGGPMGAATRLGLKRTTLQSKLKHLGINPRNGQSDTSFGR